MPREAPLPSAATRERDEPPDVVAASRGDRAAFERLVARHHAGLYQFLLRRCASPADAEDAAQDAFVLAWRGLPRFDPTGPAAFRTWLFTIGAHAAATQTRKRGSAQRAADAYRRNATPTHASIAPEPTETPAPGGLWELADRVLASEPRAMLWLRYAEELSPAQIARVLGRSEVGVRVALHRARARLARAAANPSPAAPSSAEYRHA